MSATLSTRAWNRCGVDAHALVDLVGVTGSAHPVTGTPFRV